MVLEELLAYGGNAYSMLNKENSLQNRISGKVKFLYTTMDSYIIERLCHMVL